MPLENRRPYDSPAQFNNHPSNFRVSLFYLLQIDADWRFFPTCRWNLHAEPSEPREDDVLDFKTGKVDPQIVPQGDGTPISLSHRQNFPQSS
ncbi:hypothetical protein CEXT_483901 [Caerostris extrusa]|uniref:Uncharacterized protein n=1 Tax=Caerostris extrusa TaxID=172846 RepID=A0AAV4QWF7_CAEEX|nr:hypothetical protein CEXT_483901 [Caerostris extrusa]